MSIGAAWATIGRNLRFGYSAPSGINKRRRDSCGGIHTVCSNEMPPIIEMGDVARHPMWHCLLAYGDHRKVYYVLNSYTVEEFKERHRISAFRHY
jgi:hypothetical protein